MPDAVLVELCDLCIRATRGGETVYAEPGMALLLAGQPPVLGSAALQALRQQPGRVHSRFWQELDTRPIPIKKAGVRHSADLVWHQLADIKAAAGGAPFVFCVPSHLSHEQLELLAGICRSLDIEVQAILNLGLAQMAAQPPGESLCHVDLQLHQTVISRYEYAHDPHEQGQGQLALRSHEVLLSHGFLRLVDRLLQGLSERFIQSSRFDPLHSGGTEQQLFDQVRKVLDGQSLAAFTVDSGAASHSLDMNQADIEATVDGFVNDLLGKVSARYTVLAPAFAPLPGVQKKAQPSTYQIIDGAAAAAGAAALLADLEPGAGTAYISQTTLGPPANSTPPPTAPAAESPPLANALVHRGLVYAAANFSKAQDLAAEFAAIQFAADGICVTGPDFRVNGQPADRAKPLVAGDRLEVAGHALLAVRLME
ncbi:MAG: hypothetical protein GDA55_03760 [Cellvibrionales bacterium]|nr:hypothetical protein [Cellvibrionales bacterium]